MSNTQRPTTARVHTRSSDDKRQREQDAGVSISVDGKAYTVRVGDLSGLDSMALRRETGMALPDVISALQTSPDIDLVAIIMWLSRRIEGEQMLAFADVAKGVTYDSDIDQIVDAEPEEDPQA